MLDETIVNSKWITWNESIKIVEKYTYPEIAKIKSQYYEWLISNDQLDKAQLKELDGDFKKEIELYIQGGYPINADDLVKAYDNQVKFDIHKISQLINYI